MRLTAIPNTELTVSSLCLGTSPLGSSIDEAASFRLLDQFVELGGTFLDTSRNYADWACEIKSVSEKTIGKWMKDRNAFGRIVVGTKGACPSTERFFRLSRADIMDDLHSSLRNLQTDCIDLYWLHRDDLSVPAEDIWQVLVEAVEAGKIRYFACSNWTVSRIVEVQQLAQASGKPGFCASQIMWSLAEPNREQMADSTIVVMDEETERYHRQTGLALAPFSAQAGGFFGGRYDRPSPGTINGGKPSVQALYGSEANYERYDRVREVAEQLGETTGVVALACLYARPFPVIPIVGPRTPEQLADCCRAGELRLDEQTAQYIEYGTKDGRP
ncbi:aldo/keto reductase [Paenibacillus hodogayensis]|uniref:Aldo/keto reductase n=1 Tax=Paenibacillus hodogayensis TaxID=279208 RepID=A0ABV5VXM9_9BACL